MSINKSNINLAKYELNKKIPFSDLDKSIFQNPQISSNDSILKDCYLFLEDINDINNPKLNLKIGYLSEDSSMSIYLPKITHFLNLKLTNSGKSTVILKSGVRGTWSMRTYNNSSVTIGKIEWPCNVTLYCEPEGEINIEDYSMFSDGITIQCGSEHGIISLEDKKILNSERSIIKIGNHFWCGRNSTIVVNSKKLNIGSGSILGIGSVLTRSMPKNCIFAGNPAKKIKENVSWTIERFPNFQRIENVWVNYHDPNLNEG